MMVFGVIGMFVLLLAIVGLFQTGGDLKSGVARVPQTLWRVQGPYEIERSDNPIAYWAAIAGRGFFSNLLAVIGLTMSRWGISP